MFLILRTSALLSKLGGAVSVSSAAGFAHPRSPSPTALAYWTRVLMVKLTIRREVFYIERAFCRARKAAGLT